MSVFSPANTPLPPALQRLSTIQSPRIKSLFITSHIFPKCETEYIKILGDWIIAVIYAKVPQ